jgi:tartrate-resistant acid phosphatase type 5
MKIKIYAVYLLVFSLSLATLNLTACTVPPSPLPGATASLTPWMTSMTVPLAVRFAVIGDYGMDNAAEADVAALIHSWNPDIIITIGDNNYPSGAAETIDANVGKYFHDYIYPYSGAYGAGADENRFFPSLGNHDWLTDDARPYFDYFTLPGNERYYDFARGPVHFFALDSDEHEPDGINRSSVQATWLQERLAASTTSWQVVYMHYPPYSSGWHGSNLALQWPFATWGADAVLAGHDHSYERLTAEGIPYFVDGLGGGGRYDFGSLLPQSQFRYNGDYGAMLVTATETDMLFEFYSRTGERIDQYTLSKP